MPRDGSNVYHRPSGTDGIPNYTIESAKYNSYVADVEQDLNLPRPIVAGGTGANNARDAMTSLQGDVAYQVVTNYDAYAFVSGSFYSAAGATSAPTANAFIGQCYTSDPAVVPPAVPAGQNMFIEARDVTTGLKYLRQKTAGVWAAWKQLAGSVADLDAAYVNVSGDTMTGPLTVTGAGGNIGITSTDTRGGGGAVAMSANFNGLGQPGVYTVGAFPLMFGTNTTLGMSLNSGALTVAGSIISQSSIFSAPNATTGMYQFGNSGTKYLNYDGANFSLVGGTLIVPGNISCGPGGATAVGATLVMNSGSAANGGAFISWQKNSANKWNEGHKSAIVGGGSTSDNLIWASVAANRVVLELDSATGFAIVNPAGGGLPAPFCAMKVGCSGGGSQYGIGIQVQADNTNFMSFHNSAGTGVGSIGETATTTSYNTTSSGELKEDLKSFDAGNIIDQTNVYDFAWKKTGERSYGVIAQQAVEVYPLAVTHSVPDEGDEFWGVDYSKYVPVLLQELKALRMRVAQLEGRAGAGAQPA
jgi:hypothetical protein